MTTVFMDTETLGLPDDAPVWEFAAIRREDDGTETEFHAFFDHDEESPFGLWTDEMPESFVTDYRKRFDYSKALKGGDRAAYVYAATRGAHIVGAVPSFDTIRLNKLLHRYSISTPWHYHLCDIENVVVGYLAGIGRLCAPPWKSDQLSMFIGVDPAQFPRHTAMGDVLWTRAQWDAVMGRPGNA